MDKKYYFEDVALLITHYNRSKSLERLLESLREQRCFFEEIVVSDDCSNAEHRAYIEENLVPRFGFRFLTVPRNGGLGQNINKGQDAVICPFTLYIQEDFIALNGCGEHIQNGRALMKEQPDLDIVRFYSYLGYPRLVTVRAGFSEMIFKVGDKGLHKFAFYSDHPHLRRSNFLQQFGRYKEGLNPENTEFRMMISFLQRKGKGLLFEDYKSVFEQVNTAVEPSTMKRKFWRFSDSRAIMLAVTSYRYLKFYGTYFFRKIR